MSTLSAPPREEAGASGLPRLPEALARWIGDAALTESSGRSGMRTLRVGGARGAYLKIGPPGTLARAARMQRWWADRGLSAPVAQYLSEDADYLLIEAVPGRNGIAPEHLAQPVRLARALGEALRRLREIDAADCPGDALACDLEAAPGATYAQERLDLLSPFIGPAAAARASAELAAGAQALRRDALVHGDACLPNLMLDDWRFSGFIDLGDAGRGDPHYDMAWSLWSLMYNLRRNEYGEAFLDAYGREAVDPARLRLCALLVAME